MLAGGAMAPINKGATASESNLRSVKVVPFVENRPFSWKNADLAISYIDLFLSSITFFGLW